MKKEFLLTIILQSSILVVALLNVFSTHKWLFKSGLNLLTRSPMQILFTSLLASLCTLLLVFFFSKKRKLAYPTISLIYSIPCSILEFMFFRLLTFNIEKFFGLQMAKWSDNYQSREVQELEKLFKCCGYFVYNEYPSTFCPYATGTEAHPPPCMQQLIKAFEKPLHGCGIVFLTIGIARIISSISFLLSYNPDEDSSNTGEKRPFLR